MLPIKQFEDFISEKKLFERTDRILLAVSGGKDSVLMAHLFKVLGQNVGVAHVNFNLRGEESQRDEDFVKNLATDLNLPFFSKKFNTKEYAVAQKISTQMAARELRYNWFEELRVKEHYDFIALAQHKSDSTETMLINLLRGTGISGMHGIFPKREKLVRPLLFLTSDEIAKLIAGEKLDYVEDSSNLSSAYMRNKIRLEIIPRMREINPKLEQTFTENAVRFAAVESFLTIHINKLSEELIVRKVDGFHISIEKVKTLNPISLLLFELLKPFHFSASVVNDIISGLDGLTGKQFFSPENYATIDRGQLIITALHKTTESQFIDRETKAIQFGNYQLYFDYKADGQFEKTKNKAYCNEEKIIYPLTIRRWQHGDKFIPIGMLRFKKISDFFIDQKISIPQKENTPLIVNGNGDIIWVAGMRQDNRYKVEPSTKKVAIFEIK